MFFASGPLRATPLAGSRPDPCLLCAAGFRWPVNCRLLAPPASHGPLSPPAALRRRRLPRVSLQRAFSHRGSRASLTSLRGLRLPLVLCTAARRLPGSPTTARCSSAPHRRPPAARRRLLLGCQLLNAHWHSREMRGWAGQRSSERCCSFLCFESSTSSTFDGAHVQRNSRRSAVEPSALECVALSYLVCSHLGRAARRCVDALASGEPSQSDSVAHPWPFAVM